LTSSFLAKYQYHSREHRIYLYDVVLNALRTKAYIYKVLVRPRMCRLYYLSEERSTRSFQSTDEVPSSRSKATLLCYTKFRHGMRHN